MIRNTLALALFTLPLLGCGGSGELPTTSVSGRVLCNGKPLEFGTIGLIPSKGRSASGKIGSDGSFTLGTYDSGDGAIVGKHQIVITSEAESHDAEAPKLPCSSPEALFYEVGGDAVVLEIELSGGGSVTVK